MVWMVWLLLVIRMVLFMVFLGFGKGDVENGVVGLVVYGDLCVVVGNDFGN